MGIKIIENHKYFLILAVCFSSLNFGLALGKNVAAGEVFLAKVVDFLNAQSSIITGCSKIEKEKSLKKPDTRVVVLDESGIVLYFQDESFRVWRKLPEGSFIEEPVFVDLMKNGKENSVAKIKNIFWNDSVVEGDFEVFYKNGKKYIAGVITFITNQKANCKELVFRAFKYFKENGLKKTIVEINNPLCSFLQGSFSVELYDSVGLCLADSYDITRVGREASFWIDEDNTVVFDKLKKSTENNEGFGWSSFTFYKGLKKKIFSMKITLPDSEKNGNNGKVYYLVSGFYPQANKKKFVVSMAKLAKKKLLKNLKNTIDKMNSPKSSFYRARISCVVYDEKGLIVANSKSPFLVGSSTINKKDTAGFFVTKNILKKAKKDKKGWVLRYSSNAAELIYLEKLKVGSKNLILTIQGYTPIDKRTFSFLKAKWVCSALLVNPAERIFRASVSGVGLAGLAALPDVYADLFVEVYSHDGFCMLSGNDIYPLWKKMDEQMLKITERKENGWFSYKKEDQEKKFYLQLCSRSKTEKYLVVVGYNYPIV